MLRTLVTAALLLALPALASAAAPDYTDYQKLLDRYLVRLEPANPATDTQFDYERLCLEERVPSLHRSATLAKIRAQLLAVDPATLSASDRTAWAINTYNFLVIERATINLLVPRKRLTRFKSVDDIKTPEGTFFGTPMVAVDGRKLTLAEFERRIVYGDTTPMHEARARAADPRLALALCSGHMGDPPLAMRAYRGDSLETQLTQAARTALAQRRFVLLHDDTNRLDVADYLAQRRIDFGGSIDAIVPFVERYAPEGVRKAIRKNKITKITLMIPTNRSLNQWPHPRTKPSMPVAET